MHLLHSSIDDVSYCAIAAFAYFHPQANAETLRHQHTKRVTQMGVATQQTALRSAPAFGLASMIETAKTRFARYRAYRQTVNELSELSDRELADLGLHRSMIRRLAMQAAEEQFAR